MSTVDSLPYYDRDLDVVPNLRQRAEREIELELKSSTLSQSRPGNDLSSKGYHPFLSEFPEPGLSSSIHTKIYHPFLRTSLPRLLNRLDPNYQNHGEKDHNLDFDRFNIPYPDDPTNVEAWEKALSNAKSQLEHQRLRLLNLDLISRFGENHWKLSNYLIEKEIAKVNKSIESFRTEIDNVNRRRKASQTAVGDELTDLSQKWQNLISTNISVEITNLNSKAEVEALRADQTELKQKLSNT